MPNDQETNKQKDDNTWKNRRRMAWLSLVSVIVVTLLTLTPLVTETRLSSLQPILSTFFFAMASVIGVYVGFSTMSDKWKNK